MGFETIKAIENVTEQKRDFAQDEKGRSEERRSNSHEHHVEFIRKYLDELKIHDKKTYEHSMEVGNIASFVVESLSGALSEDERDILLGASLLHDCGKIGIESEILNKEDRLSHEEMEKITFEHYDKRLWTNEYHYYGDFCQRFY